MLLYYLADINYVTGSPTQVQPNGKEEIWLIKRTECAGSKSILDFFLPIILFLLYIIFKCYILYILSIITSHFLWWHCLGIVFKFTVGADLHIRQLVLALGALLLLDKFSALYPSVQTIITVFLQTVHTHFLRRPLS